MTDRREFLRRALALPLGSRPPWSDVPPEAPALPLVANVDGLILTARLRRLLATVESFGPGGDVGQALRVAATEDRTRDSAEAVQRVLDRTCLVGVHINPELRVKLTRGGARAELVTGSWRPFLVKVHNEAGTTARLRATSAQTRGAAHGWLELGLAEDVPLSGSALEYHALRLRSREAGLCEASLAFDVGQGSQDLGFRNEVPILFDCRSW